MPQRLPRWQPAYVQCVCVGVYVCVCVCVCVLFEADLLMKR